MPKPELATADEATATLGDDGALGVAFAGRVGKGPVRVVEIELIDDAGQAFHVFEGWFPWLGRPNRFFTAASVGHLDADADTFRGFATFVDSKVTTKPSRVRVSLGELNELMGPPLEVAVTSAAPMPLEVGERCDPFEVVNRCGEDAWCEVPDGVIRDSPSCLEPVEACPSDFPILESAYQGSNAKSPDQTLASCTNSRGMLGSEQGHVFVAHAAGTYRFVAASGADSLNAATTLFVRRYCQYADAKAELGCVHQLDNTTDPSSAQLPNLPLTLEVPLGAGEKVYVFVEAWWANGGDYELSVTAVD